MKHHNITAFTTALDCATRDLLAARGLGLDEEYRLHVEQCPVHGRGCARVTYGVLRDHVTWAWADARVTAAAMLSTMFPVAPGGR